MENIFLIAALILAGLVLIALEFITPTLGVLGMLAMAAFGAAIWLTWGISSTAAIVLLFASLLGLPIYIVTLIRWLPKTPLGKRMFLKKASSYSGASQPEAQRYSSLVGKTGVASTPLRPSGAVRIENRRYYAMAESGQIDSGSPIEVVRYDGMDIIVRQADQAGPASDTQQGQQQDGSPNQ